MGGLNVLGKGAETFEENFHTSSQTSIGVLSTFAK